MMVDSDQVVEGPVAFVATREVKPKHVEEYRAWVSDLGAAARAIDDNFRMTVIEPGGSQTRQYVLILFFSDHDRLAEWEQSDARSSLLKRLQPLVSDKASFNEVTGFEYWFSLPRIAATKPPARYKMALVTMLGLYIMSLTYTYTANVWLDSLPDHLGLILRVVILVVIMTFLVMPLLTRLFARWLYPRSERAASA